MDHPVENNVITWQTDIAMCLPACMSISFVACFQVRFLLLDEIKKKWEKNREETEQKRKK